MHGSGQSDPSDFLRLMSGNVKKLLGTYFFHSIIQITNESSIPPLNINLITDEMCLRSNFF